MTCWWQEVPGTDVPGTSRSVDGEGQEGIAPSRHPRKQLRNRSDVCRARYVVALLRRPRSRGSVSPNSAPWCLAPMRSDGFSPAARVLNAATFRAGGKSFCTLLAPPKTRFTCYGTRAHRQDAICVCAFPRLASRYLCEPRGRLSQGSDIPTGLPPFASAQVGKRSWRRSRWARW